VPAAARAEEAVGPARGEQVLAARLLGAEALLELQDRQREVRAGHARTLRIEPDGANPVRTTSVQPPSKSTTSPPARPSVDPWLPDAATVEHTAIEGTANTTQGIQVNGNEASYFGEVTVAGYENIEEAGAHETGGWNELGNVVDIWHQ